jgi:hypothetical protein
LIDDLTKKNVTKSNLLDYLKEKMQYFDSESGDYHDPKEFDDSPTTLLQHATTEKEEELIWYNQHYAIFCRYRNFLVHEARTPGYAMEGIRKSEYGAFYHGYVGDALKGWHLAYPIKLFFMLLTKTIDNLKAYFIDQNQDPFIFVGNTTRW